MSSGHIISMMLAVISSLMVLLRYVCWMSVRGFWWGIFFGNMASGGMLMWCLAPGMVMTSLTDNAKQSANLDIILVTCIHSSTVRSGPILTCFNISATCSGLNGSFFLVNIDLSPSNSTSGCRALSSLWVSSSTVITGSSACGFCVFSLFFISFVLPLLPFLHFPLFSLWLSVSSSGLMLGVLVCSCGPFVVLPRLLGRTSYVLLSLGILMVLVA